MTDNSSEDRQIARDWLDVATGPSMDRADHFKAAQVHALLDIAQAIREASKPVSTVVHNHAPVSQEAREAIKRENEQWLANLNGSVNRHA